jgi:hypothetical protein
VYAADAAGHLSPVARGDPALVYAPNSLSNTVDVISQRMLRMVERVHVADRPPHVVPGVRPMPATSPATSGNRLQAIDPAQEARWKPDHGR